MEKIIDQLLNNRGGGGLYEVLESKKYLKNQSKQILITSKKYNGF